MSPRNVAWDFFRWCLLIAVFLGGATESAQLGFALRYEAPFAAAAFFAIAALFTFFVSLVLTAKKS